MAAIQLGISQSGVSHAIKSLEQELGVGPLTEIKGPERRVRIMAVRASPPCNHAHPQRPSFLPRTGGYPGRA
ncbi:MAG: LysR family transcriptional regulator, partial [Burkholderiales bacterium]|nr:LysR family transcriptional regulator [Burkholderiales bacterium]